MGGEEDFCESSSTATCTTFLHYGDDENTQVMRRYKFDQTQWHTLRFVRRNLTVSAYIDDLSAPVWTYQGSAETLPETFKRTVLQQECPVRGCPRRSSGFEDIQIDWITVERPA
jgi:hypothetical protein